MAKKKQIKPRKKPGMAKKVTDEQFWSALAENCGLYSKTMRAIKKQYGIDITRQAIKERAERDQARLDDIRDSVVEVAEDGIFSLAKDKSKYIRLEACSLIARTLGKNRGWVTRQEAKLIDKAVIEVEIT